MSGATLGATAQWRRLSLDVFASRALHLPGFMAGEGTLVGVRLSCSL
jgi:hemolysin activation/secretion protein